MLQKKLLVAAALAGFSMIGFSSAANAALPGYYVGGQLGWANTHLDDNIPSGITVDDTGLAGRLFTGYQFNQNFAAELGYTHFSKSDVKVTGFGKIGDIKEYAVDLVAKGIMPLNNGISLYGKLGPAWLKGDASNSLDGTSSDESKVYPTFGVGVSYDLTPNVPVDLSWNRIQRVGGSDNIPSTDLFSLGIAYNFG
jgi:OOP family OmpA-OmpF porin